MNKNLQTIQEFLINNDKTLLINQVNDEVGSFYEFAIKELSKKTDIDIINNNIFEKNLKEIKNFAGNKSALEFEKFDKFSKDLFGLFKDPIMRGGSCIVSPLGKILASAFNECRTIIYAEVDLDLITKGKYDFDVVGHYSRPDIFQLKIDKSVKKPIG